MIRGQIAACVVHMINGDDSNVTNATIHYVSIQFSVLQTFGYKHQVGITITAYYPIANELHGNGQRGYVRLWVPDRPTGQHDLTEPEIRETWGFTANVLAAKSQFKTNKYGALNLAIVLPCSLHHCITTYRTIGMLYKYNWHIHTPDTL